LTCRFARSIADSHSLSFDCVGFLDPCS